MAQRNRPSLLLINRTYPPVPGATGRLLWEAARGFARSGWDVTVLTTGPEAGQVQEAPGLNVIRVKGPAKPRGLLGYVRLWWALRRAALAQPAPDLVVSMTDPPLAVCIGDAVARRRGCPHLHWCQDVYPDLLSALAYPLPGPAVRLLALWARTALARCARVVVIGRCMARHLVRAYGLGPSRVSVIPNWPDLALSPHHAAPHGEKPPQALKESGPRFRVLYAGTMGRAHDPEPILDAVRALAETNPEIVFLFAGDGPGMESIERARAAEGLENIRLLPPQPTEHLRNLLESGDVHIVGLKGRALGLCVPCKVYSAFTVGRPCIVLAPPGSEAARVVAEFGAGAVLENATGEALAARILAYRTDSQTWFTAAQGATRAGRVFTPRASIRAFVQRARALIR
ncbi:MAG: glycosyltransferase family 4 protein [Alphaproteobacteria bacterium]|nr:glycosyltransferase family 4 protein [Alphaproteobacteria bacterium]